MCIIAVSKKGVEQPTEEQLKNMFIRNPHGAGYMYARDGQVHIHKGFMTFKDFIRNVKDEHFTKNDSVVYHFRISTQAGVKPQMTHPFPLTTRMELCEQLDIDCPIGIAHNGIIHMTSDVKETRFSDTVIFIAEYMTKLIRGKDDLDDPAVLDMIVYMTNRKWAMLDLTGEIVTVGKFVNEKGILFSNETFKPYVPPKTTYIHKYNYPWNSDDYYEGYFGTAR